MEIILPFLFVAAAIWATIVVPRISLLLFGLSVIVIGAVFGAEFFNTKVGPFPVTIDRLLWIGLTSMILWTRINRPAGKFLVISPVDYLLAGFLLVVFVSTFTHDWKRSDNLPLGRLLFFQLIPASFFWLGRNISFKAEELKSFAMLGVVFGIYLALTGVAEKFGWHSLVFPGYIIHNENFEFFGRARGPFINPVGNGIVQVFCFGCCCQLWRSATQAQRVFLAFAIAILCAGIFCTMTRSVWLGLCAAVAVTVWFSFPAASRGGLLTSAAVAGVVVVFALTPFLNHFKRDQYVSAEEMKQSIGLRPMLFAVAYEMGKEKPFFGHGYGQYKKIAAPYHRTSEWNQPIQTVQPYLQHNVFLAFFVELGFVGVGLFAILLGCFFFNSGKLLIDHRLKPEFRMLCLTVFVVNLNMLINGLFHDVSLIVVVGSLFFFINGLAYSIRDRQVKETQVCPTRV